MNLTVVPAVVPNQIGGRDVAAASSAAFDKIDPATGRVLCQVARSGLADIERAVERARGAQAAWAATTVVKRGEILRRIAVLLQQHRADVADLVARETGKSRKDAMGETDAAIEMGFFVAGEGRRFYGRTTTSGTPNKTALIMRQPLGVAGLIIAANTPIANVAWKAFPALLCGNTAVLKASEDTPLSAWAFGLLAREAGLPDGVYNTVHGLGEEAGAPLVEHADVDVVSFTGSCTVGRWIAETAGRRLAKVCLELGGKNPLIVCDDADLAGAVMWTVASAFSNAGQRCAAGSRIIVFDAVYDRFRDMLVKATRTLKVGSADTDDYGPVINEEQADNMLASVTRALAAGALLLTGGRNTPDDMKLVQQISFTVESIAVLKEFREILEAEGLPIDSISTHGNAASVYFRDPKGNRLEVYYSIPVEWPQPFRKPINLDQDDDAVLQQIHDLTFGATVK